MTIEDVKVIIQGDETRTLENWGSGVGRMVDACKNANLPEPEFNQNAAFVWVTFKRATIQPYNPSTPQVHPSTPRPQRIIVRLKS